MPYHVLVKAVYGMYVLMTHSLCDVQLTTFQLVLSCTIYKLPVKAVCGMVLVLYFIIVITVDL